MNYCWFWDLERSFPGYPQVHCAFLRLTSWCDPYIFSSLMSRTTFLVWWITRLFLKLCFALKITPFQNLDISRWKLQCSYKGHIFSSLCFILEMMIQGTVWMGLFMAPGLPLVNVIKLILIMYIKVTFTIICNKDFFHRFLLGSIKSFKASFFRCINVTTKINTTIIIVILNLISTIISLSSPSQSH